MFLADLKKRIEECDIKYSKLTHTDQTVGGTVIAGNTIFSMFDINFIMIN